MGNKIASEKERGVGWILEPSSLEPVFEVFSRIGGEGVGEGDGRGLILRHGGWMDGWMGTSKGLNTTVDPSLS